MNLLSPDGPYYYLPKCWHFFFNHPVYYAVRKMVIFVHVSRQQSDREHWTNWETEKRKTYIWRHNVTLFPQLGCGRLKKMDDCLGSGYKRPFHGIKHHHSKVIQQGTCSITAFSLQSWRRKRRVSSKSFPPPTTSYGFTPQRTISFLEAWKLQDNKQCFKLLVFLGFETT